MYRVKTVAEMLGVPRNTLIAWERRLGIVDPRRTDGGYRAYDEVEVARLRRLKDLVDAGLKVSEAWALIQREDLHPSGIPADAEPLVAVRRALTRALMSFDKERADRSALALLSVPFEVQLTDVLFPLLAEVGAGWATGEVSVAQEHFATAWCRERMMIMLHAVSATTGPEVVCATPPGETHELGLLGVGIRLALRQFRVVMLGADVPTHDLIEHLTERPPYGVCLSVVHQRPASELVAWAKDLRRRIPPQVRLAIGGRATTLEALPEVPGVSFTGAALPAWSDVGATLRARVG